MNRSILIVICDFLLVSLLVFSTPDLTKINGNSEQASLSPKPAATNAPSGGKDLAAVMRTALGEEQQKREQLLSELAKTRQSAAQKETELQQQEAALQQQYVAAQTNIATLNQQLQTRATEANASQEQLATTEANLKLQNDQAAALKQQLAELQRNAAADKERLTNQLQLADLERRNAAQQAAQMQQQVQYERAEKARAEQQAAKLAEGVQTLATNSGQLAKEIRENTPLASNTIFNDFVTNAVEEKFTATRPGFFGGEAAKERTAKTILITDGTNTFAACHVQDTPLKFWIPPVEWDGLTGTLDRGAGQVALQSLTFSGADPRVILLPVSRSDAALLGAKVYRTSADPFKFQDAVLVGAQGDYYGDCRFQIDVRTPDYVKLDRSFLKGLFGKFNPSRGDLVFSRTGELLGIMANNSYCMIIRKLDTGDTFQLGQSMRTQYLADALSRYYVAVTKLPGELQ